MGEHVLTAAVARSAEPVRQSFRRKRTHSGQLWIGSLAAPECDCMLGWNLRNLSTAVGRLCPGHGMQA